ncbi:MAG: glycine cleavage system aminomethyltransferase GcvT [Planctomycetota bacterium]
MKKTSLHDTHVELGARLVDFGGWRMPVQYGSILDEVKTVRTAAGLFDLGHMGRFRVEGPDAVALVDRVATNHCARIPVGAIRYSLFCTAEGFPIDDLLIYRDPAGVFLVVNASNTPADLAWLRAHSGGLDARVVDETEETAMLAIQGPRALEILRRVASGGDLDGLRYYRFAFGTVCGLPKTRISRTGYTGEDGFEVYLPFAEGPRVWRELLAAGSAAGLRPIGLGARDTLRLEAGMPLYGHEIDGEHDPLEAGLAFGIAFTPEKGDFVGRAALEGRRDRPSARRLVGITTAGPRVPRRGYPLFQGMDEVGVVCSGSMSPTIATNIATAYVARGRDVPGQELELEIRDRRQPCTVCELPFYSRTRKTQR